MSQDKLWWAHRMGRQGRAEWLPILAKDWYVAREKASALSERLLIPFSASAWVAIYHPLKPRR